MNRQILCTWLGVPEESWPPDHHALLGLEPGHEDAAQIEQHVQERLARLRAYQISNPEEATEGMNRLAQAYICLTERLAAKTAVAASSAGGVAVCERPAEANVSDDTVVGRKTKFDWNPKAPVPTVQPSAPTTPSEIDEIACRCGEARRGLGTLAKLIERIDRTRQLLVDWKKAGCYLGKPARRLTRIAEEKDLENRLNRIFEQIAEYPSFLGHPGRPGYRVVAMARLEMTALMFKTLDPGQRACLARDWKAGHDVLLAHRKFLHRRFKTMRREGKLRRGLRAVRAMVNDHPLASALGALGVSVLGVAAYLWWF